MATRGPVPGFVLLHLRRALARPLRVAMSVLGIAAGTSLVVTMLAVHGSLVGSAARLAQVAGDADVEVSAATDVGLASSVVDAVAATEGVASVAPLVRQDVVLDGDVVLLLGADDRAVAFGGVVGDDLVGQLARLAAQPGFDPDGVVLTRSLGEHLGTEAGDEVPLYTDAGGTHVVPVAGVLGDGALDRLNGGRLAVAPLATAQAVLGRESTVDSILVAAADGVDGEALRDRLRAELGPTALADGRAERERRAVAPAITYGTQVIPVAAMALVVGGFLVFNTMGMVVLERRRELATLRALGASRRRLVLGLVGEAAVLGLLGAAVGVGVGVVLAAQVVGALPEAMLQAIGVRVSFILPGFVPVAAFVVGVLTSSAAAVVPAVRATRSDPLDLLRPQPGSLAGGGEPTGPSWWAVAAGGSLAAVGLVVLVAVKDERATPGLLLVAVGGVLATYGLAVPLTRLAAAIARLGGGLGHLASSGLVRSPHRVWATSMAVVVAVAITVAVAGGARNQLDLDARHLADLRGVDLVVSPRPLDQLSIDVMLPPDWPEVLDGVDGVAATSSMTNEFAVLDGRRFMLAGIDAGRDQRGGASYPAFGLATAEARAATLAGEAVIVTSQFATAYDVGEGDLVAIPGAGGVLELPVADVVRTLAVSDNGVVLLADAHLRRTFGTAGVGVIELFLERGADVGRVRDEVAALADRQPFPVVVSTGEEAYQRIMTGLRGAIGMMYAILAVTAGVAGLAVLNTLVASVLDRWRELGVLRAIGTTPRQLARIIGLEALGVGAVGSLVGLLVGAVLHWAGVEFIGNASPLPVEYAFVPLVMVVAALAGVVATVVGAAIPVRRAARVDVLDAIAWE